MSLWIRKREEEGMENLKDHRKHNSRPKKKQRWNKIKKLLVEAIDEHPFEAAVTVLHNRDLNISTRIVRRRLNAANVHSRPAAKKNCIKAGTSNSKITICKRIFEHAPRRMEQCSLDR